MSAEMPGDDTEIRDQPREAEEALEGNTDATTAPEPLQGPVGDDEVEINVNDPGAAPDPAERVWAPGPSPRKAHDAAICAPATR